MWYRKVTQRTSGLFIPSKYAAIFTHFCSQAVWRCRNLQMLLEMMGVTVYQSPCHWALVLVAPMALVQQMLLAEHQALL